MLPMEFDGNNSPVAMWHHFAFDKGSARKCAFDLSQGNPVPIGMIGTQERTTKMLHDPFLNYFALGLLIFVVAVLFYGIIAIHDVPYLIAKGRNHPHQDAIHAAGWVSLFTLHALWPFLWIWAMTYRPERGWGFNDQPHPTAIPPGGQNDVTDDVKAVRQGIAESESGVRKEAE